MELKQDSEIKLCDYALIEEIKLAVDTERLPTQFTTSEVKKWMETEHIKKTDGTPYEEISVQLLSNYSKYTPRPKKRKQKILYSSPNSRVFSFNPF